MVENEAQLITKWKLHSSIRQIESVFLSELSKNPLPLEKNIPHPHSWGLGMRQQDETRRTNGT